MDLSVASLAIDLMKKPAKRRRFAADGAVTVSDIQAVIQPFAADSKAENKMDLRPGLEGERVEDLVIVWTRDDIRQSDETAGTPADHIDAMDGRVFKIVSLTARPEGGFTRAIAGLFYDRGRSL